MQLQNREKEEVATPIITFEQHARQTIGADKNSIVIEIEDDVPILQNQKRESKKWCIQVQNSTEEKDKSQESLRC